MKIKKIEIKDFKAFYGKHQIIPDGKNLFVYAKTEVVKVHSIML